MPDNKNIRAERATLRKRSCDFPNVMVGYANSVREFAISEKIDRLYTGDLARKNEEGLFFITGRRSRFVKPFGLRISLDEVENFSVRPQGAPEVIANGETIFAFFEKSD